MNILRTTLIIFTSIFSFNINAALISYDGYGYDDISGLDWMNVDLTENHSYNDVLSMTIDGGEFEGYRHATTSEFQELVSHVPQDSTVSSKVFNLGNFLGDIFYINGETPTVWGIHDRDEDGSGIEITTSKIVYLDSYLGRSNWIAYDYDESPTNNKDDSSSSKGHFLVRTHVSAVPVPAAVWLFGSGLLGLIGVARRKKA